MMAILRIVWLTGTDFLFADSADEPTGLAPKRARPFSAGGLISFYQRSRYLCVTPGGRAAHLPLRAGVRLLPPFEIERRVYERDVRKGLGKIADLPLGAHIVLFR